MASLKSEDDQARFASVVLPHLADAYALARWLTGDRADAEDVVQEACLRALRGIGGFAGVNARAWLLTIVRHAAYTWLGKNRSPSLLAVDDLEAVERQRSSASCSLRTIRRWRRNASGSGRCGARSPSGCRAARRRRGSAAGSKRRWARGLRRRGWRHSRPGARSRPRSWWQRSWAAAPLG